MRKTKFEATVGGVRVVAERTSGTVNPQDATSYTRWKGKVGNVGSPPVGFDLTSLWSLYGRLGEDDVEYDRDTYAGDGPGDPSYDAHTLFETLDNMVEVIERLTYDPEVEAAESAAGWDRNP